MKFKQVILACVLGFLLAGGIFGVVYFFSKDAPDKGAMAPEHLPRVSVFTVPERQSSRQYRASGTVENPRNDVIVCETGGQVTAVYVKEGQALKAGDPILRLDDAPIRQAYLDAQAELAAAQAERQLAMLNSPNDNKAAMDFEASETQINNAKMMVKVVKAQSDSQMSPKNRKALENAEATLNAAQKSIWNAMPQSSEAPALQSDSADSSGALDAKSRYMALLQRVQTLKKLMADQTLRMPETGRIMNISIQKGDVLLPKAVIGEITHDARPGIISNLPLDVMAGLEAGQTVLIRRPSSYTSVKAQGKITAMQPSEEITGDTGWVRVEMTFGNPTMLSPGKSVDVFFQVAGPGAMVIHADALQLREGRSVVFVVKKTLQKTWVEERQVYPGQVSDTEIEILDGVTPGERVVLEGANRLKEGQEVALINDSLDTPGLE